MVMIRGFKNVIIDGMESSEIYGIMLPIRICRKTFLHLLCRGFGKGYYKDGGWIHSPVFHEMQNSPDNDEGFSGTGPCKNKQGPASVPDRFPLAAIGSITFRKVMHRHFSASQLPRGCAQEIPLYPEQT